MTTKLSLTCCVCGQSLPPMSRAKAVASGFAVPCGDQIFFAHRWHSEAEIQKAINTRPDFMRAGELK